MKYLLTYNIFEKKKSDIKPQKEYSDADIKRRWDKKRKQIKKLSKNIRKFKLNVDKDLTSENEKTRIIACIAKIIEITGERVGNTESAQEGRHGISNLRKKHISIKGDTVTIKYIGKSHVKHEKSFTHKKVAKILKDLLKNGKRDIFYVNGVSIGARQVNNYLNNFDITSKDLRGFKSNKLMIEKLRKLGKVKDEKERKKKFNEILRDVAEEIGHKPSICRKAYLLPEIEYNFYNHGRIKKL